MIKNIGIALAFLLLIALAIFGAVASTNGTLCEKGEVFSKGICIGSDGVHQSKIFKPED